jgi:paraquat-inducible protein B
MTVKPNYFKIGIFVIVGVLLIVAGLIFFSSGVLGQKKIYVETYFDDTVSGLSVGAPLQDRGVRIGQVESIGFASREYIKSTDRAKFMKYAPYVVVVCSIDAQKMRTPGNIEEIMADIAHGVKAGYRLRLASNILTGQAMVEGTFLDPNAYPPLAVPWKPKNIYIPSAPGEISSMKESVDKILKKIESLDIEKLIQTADNALATIEKTVKDSNVPAVTSEARNLFAEARQTNAYIQQLLVKRGSKQPPTNIAEALDRLNLTLLRIDQLLSSQSPNINQTLINLREASANIRDVTENLKSNPSQIIFSKPPPQPEKTK